MIFIQRTRKDVIILLYQIVILSIYIYIDRYRCSSTLCQSNFDIKFKLEILDGPKSKQGNISADESALFVISIIFLYKFLFLYSFSLLQILLILIMSLIQKALESINKYHPTVKLLKYSILTSFLTYTFFMIYYLIYNYQGVQWKLGIFFCDELSNISEMMMVLLLIFLAKGWTICRRKISRKGRVKITFYFNIYFWVSVVSVYCRSILIYLYILIDYSGSMIPIRYLKNDPSIYVLLVIKILCLFWFCYSIYTTIHTIHRKIHFYQKFFIFSFLWMILIICILYIYILIL